MQDGTGRTLEVQGPDGERLILREFSMPVPGETVWFTNEEGDLQAAMAMGTSTYWATEPVVEVTEIVVPDGFVLTDPPDPIFG